jgi:CRISPR-associated protein Cas1
MKHHLNTLFVCTEDTYLRKEGANLVITREKEEVGRVPFHLLNGLVCIGRISFSPQLLGECGERGIAISLYTETGRFQARIEGPLSGNVLLRIEQYQRVSLIEETLRLAKMFVLGKLLNQRSVIERVRRDYGAEMDDESQKNLNRTVSRFKDLLNMIPTVTTLDELRGFEGEAAKKYFTIFPLAIRVEGFPFSGRSKRPPLDAVNALMSFVYSLLTHDIRAALEGVGLDPAAGFLHGLRPGRPSLALDMMEEFRPFFADRLVLTLINRRQLSPTDFEYREGGSVIMKDAARKSLLDAYQERKREEVLHKFINEKVSIGLLWHIQAQLLARHLRGDLDAYPPFTM